MLCICRDVLCACMFCQCMSSDILCVSLVLRMSVVSLKCLFYTVRYNRCLLLHLLRTEMKYCTNITSNTLLCTERKHSHITLSKILLIFKHPTSDTTKILESLSKTKHKILTKAWQGWRTLACMSGISFYLQPSS